MMKSARRLRRFFVAGPIPSPGQVTLLTISETYHLKNVLRLDQGEHCLITDGQGHEAKAYIKDFSEKGEAVLVIEDRASCLREKTGHFYSWRIRIFQALIQKGKMDYLIEKAQELGVDEILPIETERTVLKMTQEGKIKVFERWHKIAREASKQSGSLNLVKIFMPQTIEKALSQIPMAESVTIFHPDPKSLSFESWFKRIEGNADSPNERILNLCFGPEGGFSDHDIRKVSATRKKNHEMLEMVSLGCNILKSDTAFLGVVSAIRFLLS